MRSTIPQQLIINTLFVALVVTAPYLIDDEFNELSFLPGTTCEQAPPCPDGKRCEMIEPLCFSRICDPELVPACVSKVLGPKTQQAVEEADYIRLPGKSCEDAPPCPDERTCVMESPLCFSRRCDPEPVPICAYNMRY